MPSADLVIHGTVLTVDDDSPTAEALAVTNGRLAATRTAPSGRVLAPEEIADLEVRATFLAGRQVYGG